MGSGGVADRNYLVGQHLRLDRYEHNGITCGFPGSADVEKHEKTAILACHDAPTIVSVTGYKNN